MASQESGADELGDLAKLATGAGGGLDEVLDLACRALGMEAAYLTEFKDGEQVYRSLAGDAASFGLARDDGYPLEGSYCQRMVLGRIPSVVPDTGANDELKNLALTSLGDIGAYVGVPITLSDGQIWGTLCTVAHQAEGTLDGRAEALMQVLARLASAEIEREILGAQQVVLERRVAELESELAGGARAEVIEGVTRSIAG